MPSAPLDDRDGPRDECGVFGVYAPESEVSRLSYFALFALQHRGQESAGIAVSEGGHIMTVRDVGLVSQVFDESKLQALTGDSGGPRALLHHGRVGMGERPAVYRSDRRQVALAHNGNLITRSSCTPSFRPERALPFDLRLRDHRRAAVDP